MFLDFFGVPKHSARRQQPGVYDSVIQTINDVSVKLLLLDNRCEGWKRAQVWCFLLPLSLSYDVPVFPFPFRLLRPFYLTLPLSPKIQPRPFPRGPCVACARASGLTRRRAMAMAGARAEQGVGSDADWGWPPGEHGAAILF